MAATKEDAQLVVQLAQLGTQMADPKARGFIWGESFVSDAKEFFENAPAREPRSGTTWAA